MPRFPRALSLALAAALLSACPAPLAPQSPGAVQPASYAVTAVVSHGGQPKVDVPVKAIDAVTFAPLTQQAVRTDAQGRAVLTIVGLEAGHSVRLVAELPYIGTLAAWLSAPSAETVTLDEASTALSLALAPAAAVTMHLTPESAAARLAALAQPTEATRALAADVAADPKATADLLWALDPQTGLLPLSPELKQAENAYELGRLIYDMKQSLELDYLGAAHQVLLKREANPSRSGPLDLKAEFSDSEAAELDELLGAPAASYRLSQAVGGLNPVAGVDIRGMDLETAMMAVQSNRAKLLEDQLKEQVAAVQARNDQAAKLNAVLAALQAMIESFEDSKTKTLGKFAEDDKRVLAAGLKLDKNAKVSDVIKQLKEMIDSLSNSQQMDMLRLQSLSNKRNEAFEIMTNFIKKMKDSRTSIVGNMRYRLEGTVADPSAAAVQQVMVQRQNAGATLVKAIAPTLWGAGGAAPAVPAPPNVSPVVMASLGLISAQSTAATFQAGQFGYVPGTQAPPVVLPAQPSLRFAPPPAGSFAPAGAVFQPLPGTGKTLVVTAQDVKVIDAAAARAESAGTAAGSDASATAEDIQRQMQETMEALQKLMAELEEARRKATEKAARSI